MRPRRISSLWRNAADTIRAHITQEGIDPAGRDGDTWWGVDVFYRGAEARETVARSFGEDAVLGADFRPRTSGSAPSDMIFFGREGAYDWIVDFIPDAQAMRLPRTARSFTHGWDEH